MTVEYPRRFYLLKAQASIYSEEVGQELEFRVPNLLKIFTSSSSWKLHITPRQAWEFENPLISELLPRKFFMQNIEIQGTHERLTGHAIIHMFPTYRTHNHQLSFIPEEHIIQDRDYLFRHESKELLIGNLDTFYLGRGLTLMENTVNTMEWNHYENLLQDYSQYGMCSLPVIAYSLFVATSRASMQEYHHLSISFYDMIEICEVQTTHPS